jgi:hypothetical protein
MKTSLLLLSLCSLGISAEPSNDPFAPKAATGELRLNFDRESQSPIPDQYASKNGVFIEFESVGKDGLVFLLINNTDNPLFYYGTGITSPWFRLQIPWKRGELRDADMGRWCGTGLYLPKLLPKHCFRFKVSSIEPKFRIGLDYWADDEIRDNKKTTVWSEFVNKNGEQDGAGQPATHSESKSEGSQNPKPESEGRSR